MLAAPSELIAKYAAWQWDAVSVYPGRSAMHRLSGPAGEVHFLKVVGRGWRPSAKAEAERTAWARAYLPVPRVLDCGENLESTWLLSEGLDGADATASDLPHDVDGLVSRLAQGLRRFHNTPVEACPFQFRVADAMQLVNDRVRTNQIDAARDFHPEFASLTVEGAIERLAATVPHDEDLVVCHGDYCVPNILMRGEQVVGYVDLGELGVADRWWDLAVATWSLTWNFGSGYEDLFLASYGASRDDARMQFYRLLYDLAS